MDQFVVEAPAATGAGDPVVLFGTGGDGEPTAQEWADWCGTISYEIVTRMGGLSGRVVRRWIGDA
jgi:alanine racemase